MGSAARALICLALVGCSDHTYWRGPAIQNEDLICVPDDISYVDRGAFSTNLHAGRAVEVLSIGTGLGAENEERYIVTGGPGRDDDDVTGLVWLSQANLGNGETPHSTVPTTVAQTLDPQSPPARVERQFGRSLLAKDVQSCYESGGQWYSCGQELLVGAPDTATHLSTGYLDVYAQDPSANIVVDFIGRIKYPALTGAAEFGWATAAPEHPADPLQPWLTAPDDPSLSWLAVSAPGASTVVVFYDIDFHPTNTPDPFCLQAFDPTCTSLTQVVELTSPSSRPITWDWGYAMTAGDFNGDGYDDLAVSMPGFGYYNPISGLPGNGMVRIYWGLNSGVPFDSAVFEDISMAGSGIPAVDDWFGISMDAGRFGPGDGDALVVGAPRAGGANEGAVCAFYFDSSYLYTKQCFHNTVAGAGGGDAFGFAVQVGNFNSADTFGAETSDEALLAEVAVSSPAFEVADSGRVDIFATDSTGILDYNIVAEDILDHAGAQPDARFGEAMASGYVQETTWEDLVIGSPWRNGEDGSSTHTKADDLIACDEIDGVWNAIDAGGDTRRVKIYGNPNVTPPVMHVTFPDGFRFDLRDSGGTGALCTAEHDGTTHGGEITLPVDAHMTMWGPVWPCSGATTSVPWVDVAADDIIAAVLEDNGEDDKTIAGEVMDVTLGWDVSTGEGTLNIDLAKVHFGAFGMDPSCRLAGQPVSLTDREAICE